MARSFHLGRHNDLLRLARDTRDPWRRRCGRWDGHHPPTDRRDLDLLRIGAREWHLDHHQVHHVRHLHHQDQDLDLGLDQEEEIEKEIETETEIEIVGSMIEEIDIVAIAIEISDNRVHIKNAIY